MYYNDRIAGSDPNRQFADPSAKSKFNFLFAFLKVPKGQSDNDILNSCLARKSINFDFKLKSYPNCFKINQTQCLFLLNK